MPNLLEIDSVVKTYNNRLILSDVYLQCKTGDIIGLLGRNGTGKSTLLKILFGTLSANSKFIRINNKVYDQPYKTEGELCYLSQDPFLPKYLAIKKAIELFLGQNNVEEFLNDSTLYKLRKNKVSQLSGGELRYLEIKLLLNANTKFVLLDEPFNGVAPIMVESIVELIKEKSKNKGIILTDHDYRNVLKVANRLCLIYDGGIKEIRDKQELVEWGYISEFKLNK